MTLQVETGKRTEEYDYKYDDKGNIMLMTMVVPYNMKLKNLRNQIKNLWCSKPV